MSKTTAQIHEALDLMQEECAEIIQIISKIRRFGFASYHPHDADERTNLQLFNDEVGDFELLKRYLTDAGILNDLSIEDRIAFKKDKLQKYTSLFCN